ncbi:MAG TPA: DUF4136 domain-containing protein [Candidatus Omnitrophota bacterium]|nr:DUF4136 domain-containing protein [Candidatus Omnitrophota bacterium]HQO38163.1 DUF4136 domain-containing protein [Candidatus Omnitrophota bacterium]
MKKTLCVLLVCFLASGCATYYRVRVNGYLDAAQGPAPLTPEASFCVLENKDARNPIFDSQIRSKVEKLLTQKGYVLKPADTADFHVNFAYVVGTGQTVTDVRREYSAGETGTVITHGPDGEVRTSTVLLPARTTYVPYQYTEHTAMLTLEVIDAPRLRTSQQKKPVWIGESSTTVRDPDQRDIVNYLLAAVSDYFGQNTPKSVTALIKEDNPRAAGVR